MPRTPRQLGLALLVVTVGLLALACSSEEPDRSTATGTPTSEVPTSSPSAESTTRAPFVLGQTATASATPDLTEALATADRVITAVAAGDLETLEALLQTREVRCEELRDLVPPSACADNSTSGRSPAVAAGVCVVYRYADPGPILQRFLERAGPLLAVTENPADHSYYAGDSGSGVGALLGDTGDLRVVFRAEVGDQTLGYAAVIDGGEISLLELGCRSAQDSLLAWLESPPAVLLEGPAFVPPLPESPPPADRDPLAAPRGEYSGQIAYDRIISAMATRDADRISEVLRAQRMQCTHLQEIGSPPPCTDDELEAEIVDGFLVVGCEGSWQRADLDHAAALLAGRNADLYAIVGDEEDEQPILFVYASRDPAEPDALLYVRDGAVIGHATLTCSTAEDFGEWYPVILRGPAWPEDASSSE